MTNRERMENMLNNLNEEGLNLVLKTFEGMDKLEKYNISTSNERVEELKRIEAQKEDQELKQWEEERKKERYERAKAEYAMRKERKAALIGKEKRFFEVIENVKVESRYTMKYWEMVLLAETYNHNLINGSYDIFRYGYLKGQRAEIAKRKQINKKGKRGCINE